MAGYRTLSRDNLRLEFCAAEENAASSPGENAYELRLIDASGVATMCFRLPAEIVEPVVLSCTEIDISMTPDGVIAALPVDVDVHESANAIALDVLVEGAIAPQMLEDEPHAEALLQTLRQKLLAAISTVDTALANIGKR